jgi:para-nitrobenzyl esterase
MGEDCLNLNVWTPGVNDGGKRPVLVSYHGGWGHRLRQRADVRRRRWPGSTCRGGYRQPPAGVVRLCPPRRPRPRRVRGAGSVGVMDMVASLQWVRDNIERFGGDPGG